MKWTMVTVVPVLLDFQGYIVKLVNGQLYLKITTLDPPQLKEEVLTFIYWITASHVTAISNMNITT